MNKRQIIKYFSILFLIYYVSINVVPFFINDYSFESSFVEEKDANEKDTSEKEQENEKSFELNDMLLKDHRFILLQLDNSQNNFFKNSCIRLLSNIKDVFVPPPEKF
jgi:uncharacterized membrane protein